MEEAILQFVYLQWLPCRYVIKLDSVPRKTHILGEKLLTSLVHNTDKSLTRHAALNKTRDLE